MTTQANQDDQPAGSLWKRLLWFAALWLGGVGVIGTIAYTIRLVIKSQFPES